MWYSMVEQWNCGGTVWNSMVGTVGWNSRTVQCGGTVGQYSVVEQ